MGRMRTLGDYARGRAGRGWSFHGRGLGALAGRKSWAILAAGNAAALKKIPIERGKAESELMRLDEAARKIRNLQISAEDAAQQTNDPRAFDYVDEIGKLEREARDAHEKARASFDEADALGEGMGLGENAIGKMRRFRDVTNTIASAASRAEQWVKKARSEQARLVAIIDKAQRAAAATAAAAAAEEAERIRIEEERRRIADERRLAEENRIRDAEDARRAREEQARQAELEFQRMQIEEQRRLAEEERALEAEERERIQQIEQARIDAEMRREQMAIDAEERRRRREEEAILREEERAIRREEREAQLQQLMMIQELAAQGLPTSMLPPGLAPPMPQAPGLAPRPGGQFIPPGFGPPPGAIPQQMWSPYGPMVAGPGGMAPTGFAMQVPGVAQVPGLPAGYPGMAPPGYAATQPPGLAPSPFPQQPQAAAPGFVPSPFPQQQPQAAPPGFAWGGFDPGAEMFGLGELMPPLNPNMDGGLIEEGWRIMGPDNGNWTIYRGYQGKPTGQVFDVFTTDRLFQGAIRDPSTNQIVFIPPPRPDGGGPSAGAEIAATIREAIKATGGVLSERERARAAKYAARGAASAMPMSIPGGGFDTGPAPKRTSGAALVAVGIAAAAAAFWGIPKLIKKSKKG